MGHPQVEKGALDKYLTEPVTIEIDHTGKFQPVSRLILENSTFRQLTVLFIFSNKHCYKEN